MPGVRCTIPSCKNSCQKTKNSEKKITYHRFPKNEQVRIHWMKKCFPSLWNYNSCHICSEHFKEDDFERDFKAQLLGTPSRRILKPNAIPTQKLRNFIQEETIPLSKRRKKFHAFEEDNLVQIFPPKENQGCSNFLIDINKFEHLQTGSSFNIEIVADTTDQSTLVDEPRVVLNIPEIPLESEYKNENETLREEIKNLKKQLLASEDNYKKECEELRIEICNLKQSLSSSQLEIKTLTGKFNQDRILLRKKNSIIKKSLLELKKVLSRIFTPNQIKIIFFKKKKIKWSEKEILMALTLRNFSKESYFYMRENVKFPLPGNQQISKNIHLLSQTA